MAGPVTTITESPAGGGKTYARCAVFLTDLFLVESKSAKHISNFPVYRDKVAALVAEKTGQFKEDVEDRILVIPQDVEATWRRDVEDGGSGPWDTFEGFALDGCHIAIDEAHTVCGRHHSSEHRKRWMEFLGELRHRGATIEFITQDIKKLALEVEREAGRLFTIVNADQQREPFFGVMMSDWYELLAKLTGRWRSKVWVVEQRKVAGKWKKEETQAFPLQQKYFDLYDSYDKPKSGGQAAVEPPKREWQKRSWPMLLLWFLARNVDRVGPRLAIAGLALWLCLGGGVWAFQVVMAKYLPSKSAKEIAAQARKDAGVPEPMSHFEFERERINQRLRQRDAEIAKRAEAVVAETAPLYRVAGVDARGLIMADGTRLFPGETLPDGSEIDAVDVVRGGYLVNGRMRFVEGGPRVQTGRAVPKPLSGLGGGTGDGAGGRSAGATADVVGAGHGSGGVRPVPDLPGRPGRSAGPGASVRAGDDGGSGRYVR